VVAVEVPVELPVELPAEVKEEGNCVTPSVAVNVLKPVGGAVVPAGEGAPVDVSRLVPWVVVIVDELVPAMVGGAVVPAGEGAPVDVSRLFPWVDIKVGKTVGEPVGVTIVDELVTCSEGGAVGNGVVGDAVNGMEDDPDP